MNDVERRAPGFFSRSVLRRVLTVVISTAMLTGMITSAIYYRETQREEAIIEANEQNSLTTLEEIVANHFEWVVSDLMVISESRELQSVIAADNEINRRALTQLFISHSGRKGRYDQIRLFDETGMEVVRVNFNNGDVYAVPQDELQDKSDRYYFPEAIQLDPGEIYVSPFDLNVEGGEIEQPLKPTIRFATPLLPTVRFGTTLLGADRQDRWLLVLNFFGADLLEHLEWVGEGIGQVMLLNADGFWLKGSRTEDEWGFMYEDGANRTFDSTFGDIWQRISSDVSGRIHSEDGLFTFSTIYPLSLAQDSRGVSETPDVPGGSPRDETEYQWKLVSWVSPDTLHADSMRLLNTLLPVDGILVAMMTVGAWLLVYSRSRRTEAEKALHQAREELEARVEERLKASLQLSQQEGITQEQIAAFALEEGVKLTRSNLGYLHLVDEDQRSVQLHSWSRNALKEGAVVALGHYSLDRAGVWAECVRQRAHVIYNNYEDLPNGKDLPEWRLHVQRHLSVPVFSGGKVVAVMSVGGKSGPYDEHDGRQLSLFVQHLWNILERSQVEDRLKKSEKQYRDLVETSNDLIWSVDAGGCWTFLNRQAAKRIWGYEVEEMLGRPFAAFQTDEQAAKDLKVFERVKAGEPQFRVETVHLRKDGSPVNLSFNAVVLHDATGNVIGTTGTASDITDRKRLESDLLQSQKMEGIGRLAGGIAHDFNNVLTPVLGYSAMILEEIDQNQPIWADLQEIQKAARRATDLTQQLLAFSRKQVLEMEAVDLNAVVRNIEDMLRRVIGEDILIKTRLSADLRPITANAVQLEQIILNLALNARDAMPRGGTLTVETMNVDLGDSYAETHVAVTPGPHAALVVSDTGRGMDEQTKACIFEPFFTTKERGKGTGLGLATVYGTVKQLGGVIWVYSEPQHGATFKLYFPQAAQPAPARVRAVDPEPLQFGDEVVLLVEDDEAVRQFASTVLRRGGYTVLASPTPEHAVAEADRFDGLIHLLLTDVIMPGMTGKDLAMRIRPRRPETRVLYMSGYPDAAVASHGVLEEGVQLLQKPFSSDDLLRWVRRVLDSRPA